MGSVRTSSHQAEAADQVIPDDAPWEDLGSQQGFPGLHFVLLFFSPWGELFLCESSRVAQP